MAAVAAGCLAAVLLLDRLFPVGVAEPAPAMVAVEPEPRALPEIQFEPRSPDWFAPRLPQVETHVGDVAATILHLACWSGDVGNTTAALSLEGEPDTRLPGVEVAEVLRKRIPSGMERRVWRGLGIRPARLGAWVAEAVPWAG